VYNEWIVLQNLKTSPDLKVCLRLCLYEITVLMLSFHLCCALSVVGYHCTSCWEIMELSHLILWFMWFPFTTRQTSCTILLTFHLTGNSLQHEVYCTVLLKKSVPNFQADAYFVLLSCVVFAAFIHSCESESLQMLYTSVAHKVYRCCTCLLLIKYWICFLVSCLISSI
jgi:hypothetical protein